MEICDACNENEATLYITQVDGEEVLTRHICTDCASRMGIATPEEQFDEETDEEPAINDTLSFDPYDEPEELCCPRCGKAEKSFLEDFKAGCVKCYEAFEEQISHKQSVESGPSYYHGKQYRQAGSRAFKSELDYLKAELNSAVKQQKFELASVLRDRVNELEIRAER